jgi:murein DD-endopeptidase MepM/ murein hydrolase activator NlpD
VVYGDGRQAERASASSESAQQPERGRDSARSSTGQGDGGQGPRTERRERRERSDSSRGPSQRSNRDLNWAQTGRAGIHTVKRGETVYELARRYQVPIRSIIDANDLSPPYTLYVGQEIRIPVPRRHVVERGETVYAISRAYSVDMSELTRINGMQPPYTIQPGQVLIVPGRGTETARRTPRESPEAGTGATSEAAETAAQTPGTGPSGGAASAEATSAADRSREAQRTAAAEPQANAVSAVGIPPPPQPPARKQRSGDTTRIATSGDPAPERQRQATSKPSRDRQQAAASRPESVPKPPPRAQARFLWPVQGRVLADFGPMDGGLHNDGINIAAPAGTPIRAAENGVVAYVGNELRGFGNLLLIKHADNWVTAYAHTQEILVRHGQEVRRGQIVARVGATGSVSEPQLHFEVRRGSKAKDPEKLLGSQQAAR